MAKLENDDFPEGEFKIYWWFQNVPSLLLQKQQS